MRRAFMTSFNFERFNDSKTFFLILCCCFSDLSHCCFVTFHFDLRWRDKHTYNWRATDCSTSSLSLERGRPKQTHPLNRGRKSTNHLCTIQSRREVSWNTVVSDCIQFRKSQTVNSYSVSLDSIDEWTSWYSIIPLFPCPWSKWFWSVAYICVDFRNYAVVSPTRGYIS